MVIRAILAASVLALAACSAPADGPADAPDATASTRIAAPDASAQAFPADLRRVSLIVEDIEESLKLYRDVLEFEVNYDAEVTMSGVALPAGEPGATARLVLLNSNDSWVGWIGLLQWIDPPLERAGPVRTRMNIGDALLVFNTEKVDEHCEAVEQLPGVNVTTRASNTTYPARAGGDPIVVRTCYLFDRDGYFIELNKVLDRENYNRN